MAEMIATSEIEYPPGQCWKPGDLFTVEDAHVLLLEINGRARLAGASESPTPQLQQAAPIETPRSRGRPPKAR